MKKIVLSAAVLLLCTTTYAQKIDRSKKPAAGPAPIIQLEDPQTFTLPNGMKVLVVEDHKLPTITASLVLDRVPVLEGNKAGMLGILGSMLNEGTLSRPKAKFDEETDFIGASVGFNSSGASASALTKYFDKAFELMADGVLNPAFPAESFAKIKSQELTSLKSSQKSAKAISGRVVSALVYGQDHPFGEITTETTLNNITLNDVKAAYKQQFVPNKSYLIIVGDTKLEDVKKLATKAFANWKPGTLAEIPVKKLSNVSTTEIDIIDVPTAVQSEISVTNAIDNTRKNPDYFPLIIASNILGGGSNGYLFMNLREKHGYTYGAYANVGANRFGARFSAAASVRNAVTDSAVVQILNEIKRIGSEDASPEAIQLVKNTYNGSFAMGLEDKRNIAEYAVNIETEGLPKDFYKTFLQKLNAVSAEDVKRVAKKYFMSNQCRIIVVGKAAEIGPKLEKLGYKINYFDSYANPISKPTGDQKVSSTITAKNILDKYVSAVGGETALKKVNSLLISFNSQIQGMNINGFMAKMAPNKELLSLNMNGNTLMKQVFDGQAGYMMIQGQRRDLPADQLKEQQEEHSIFPELFYEQEGFKLSVETTTKVDGTDAYKVKITSPSGKISYNYYSSETGLLIRTEKTRSAQGQEVNSTTNYSDYKDFNGVKLPTTIDTQTGPMKIEMKVTEIKVNAGVIETDFK
ncbi:M16 family metallopeptidase [Solitalea koreensis]|uniref:Predicted Zn-dependent peptidase n=1 Tax=Solitalea koreensis TaxID=543615 RepID=A0A521EBH8_9SPHI|nr:pitrilysin family protein [Solitalea koreensis]SMO81267.1 Predicted Zn-dependent peptidase [Solitalea koreensis]